MNQELKRSIILEHYQNPKNKGLVESEEYIKVNMNSDSCIDEVNLMAKIKDGKIEDIRFDGEACAICTSATSIMTDTLIGKTVEEAKKIINNYYNMIDEKEYDSGILEQANVYDDIYKQPNRKKCALLSWWGADKLVKEYENEN
jgi:nitrogen fixation NifU-like protein